MYSVLISLLFSTNDCKQNLNVILKHNTKLYSQINFLNKFLLARQNVKCRQRTAEGLRLDWMFTSASSIMLTYRVC